MIVRRLKPFIKQYKKLPPPIRKKADKQLILLLTNWQHPSLHTKKMKGYKNIWELRVDYHHRLTFQVTPERLTLRTISAQDILNKP